MKDIRDASTDHCGARRRATMADRSMLLLVDDRYYDDLSRMIDDI